VNENRFNQLFPAPEDRPRPKLRRPRFGSTLASRVELPAERHVCADAPSGPPFRMTRPFPDLGLTVTLRELRAGDDAGNLWVDVRSSNRCHLGLAASVGLVGKGDELHRLTVELNAEEEDGCSGGGVIGPLSEIVQELGTDVELVVFLLE
jgi:hypothetical protein